jgi:hypothetical protein
MSDMKRFLELLDSFEIASNAFGWAGSEKGDAKKSIRNQNDAREALCDYVREIIENSNVGG